MPFSPPFPQSVGQYHRTFFVIPVNVLTTILSLSLLTGRWQLLHNICFMVPSFIGVADVALVAVKSGIRLYHNLLAFSIFHGFGFT
jgi:hypothetical protein